MNSNSRDKCPACYGMLEEDGTCSCGFGVKPVHSHSVNTRQPEITRECPLCGRQGYLSRSTNGAGPWYCREHFA